MMAVEVIVRRARRSDEAARGALLRHSLQLSFLDTCFYFFCQEFVLQCCVLAGAVLFIFMGWGPYGCCLLLPTAAGIVALGVYTTNMGLVEKQIQSMRGELAGWVAEAPRSTPPPPPPTSTSTSTSPRCSVRLLEENEAERARSLVQIVGTVSVSRHWEPRRSGWLHALHVEPPWRRTGVGRALVEAAVGWAAAGGLDSLEAVVSDLQPAARSCLHKTGWQLRGSYQRRVVWSALTLPMAQLALDLPH